MLENFSKSRLCSDEAKRLASIAAAKKIPRKKQLRSAEAIAFDKKMFMLDFSSRKKNS